MASKIQLKPINEQVIVITGASSGIGLCTAEEAARRGAKVVLASRSKETLHEVVNRIKAFGGDALWVACDVTIRQDIEQVAETAVTRYGRIDTWVNNAGVGLFGRLDEVTEADSRKLFDVNFWGLVNGSLIAMRYLKRQGGALINIGSEASEAAVPILGMYAASKHAVKGFTDSLRIEVEELDKAPVAITLIQPTAVDTPFPQDAKNYLEHEPKLPNPMIEAQQVAEAILAAAVKPTLATKVGMMAKVNTTVSKLAPGIATKMAAKQAENLESNEPPRNPEGTFDHPGERGHIRGDGPKSKA